MVLACHYCLNPRFNANHKVVSIPFLGLGSVGVDLFFVLSGFLISGLLFSEFKTTGSINVIRFWIRRGFKIYPAFYAFLAVTAISALVGTHALPKELLEESVFLQNYFTPLWVHTWSLAVEEQFYFLLPLVLLLMLRLQRERKNPFRFVPLISILISALCLYFRILAYRHGATIHQVVHPGHLRMDALFAGVTLGYYSHFDPESFRDAGRKWVLAVGLFFCAALVIMPDLPRLTFAYVAFAFIVAWSAQRPRSNNVLVKSLAWVGYYSYSIYLWHVIAMALSQRLPAYWFRFPLYLTFAVVFGFGMAKLIEVPFLKLRDTIFLNSARKSAKPFSLPQNSLLLLPNSD